MSDTPVDAPTPRWWPGRTSAIISGALAALAVPLIVFTAWMFVWIVDAFYCDRASHGGGADACQQAAIRFIVGVTLGPVTLALGGAMMLCAAGLFLRPGLRGRVMLIIGGLIIRTPIALVLVVLIKRFIWIRSVSQRRDAETSRLRAGSHTCAPLPSQGRGRRIGPVTHAPARITLPQR